MKSVAKEVIVKVLTTLITIAIVICGGYFIYTKIKDNNKEINKSTIDTLKEKLEEKAELNTASYLCTDCITQSNSKSIGNVTLPLTTNVIIIKYDCEVKAGIKDLTQATITENDNVITVTLPDVEVLSVELDTNSFEQIDVENTIFNPIEPQDINTAQDTLKNDAKEKAIEKGVLDMARTNAETIIKDMLESDTYTIEIVWQ